MRRKFVPRSYVRNKEPYPQPYSSHEKVFHHYQNVATYPMNDYKKEGYPSKPQFRVRPYKKIYFANPNVFTPSFQDLKKIITIG